MTPPKSNFFILLVSNDITIVESIEKVFNFCNIILYSNNDVNLENFDLIILDDFNLNNDFLSKLLLKNNIINISKETYENFENIKRPFLLKSLFKSIKTFIDNKDKILEFKNFKIINNILFFKDKEIVLGNKELEIIKFLHNNKNKFSKNILLKEIWNYNEDLETKVLENTINKIRQKLKSIDIDDFLLIEEGKYFINEIYY